MYPNVTTLYLYLLLPSGLFFFFNTHLTPIGFLPACNTFLLTVSTNIYASRNYSLLQLLISSIIFSIQFNTSSITFGVFKSLLNSSEFNENIISLFNSCSYASNRMGKFIILILIVSSLNKIYLSCTKWTILI